MATLFFCWIGHLYLQCGSEGIVISGSLSMRGSGDILYILPYIIAQQESRRYICFPIVSIENRPPLVQDANFTARYATGILGLGLGFSIVLVSISSIDLSHLASLVVIMQRNLKFGEPEQIKRGAVHVRAGD